jgi:N6-adenosine-specific RNA methylase IME4
MVGKPREGRKRALTATQVKRRYRARKKHAAAIAHRAEVMAERVAASARAEAQLATTTKLYLLFLIDPPWDDNDDAYSEAGKGRAAANHYATMTDEQMKQRHPKLPAAPDSLCYIWTTSGRLRQAIGLMEFWGFTYAGCGGWDKDRIGKGRRHRMQEEFWIWGNKGDGLPVPDDADKTPNHFQEKSVRRRGVSSVKPDKLADDLVRQYPGSEGRRLEMFARRPREGWDVHGNEGLADADAV